MEYQDTLPHHIIPPDHEQHPIRQRKRRKGPARRESDRARAAQHRARFQPDTTAVSSCGKEQAGALKLPPVLLPITGKLLPVKPVTPPPSNATAPAATPPTCVPQPSVTTAPTKTAAEATPKRNLDFKSARRHLFSNVPPNQKPTLAPARDAYKIKEDKLWTRLFK